MIAGLAEAMAGCFFAAGLAGHQRVVITACTTMRPIWLVVFHSTSKTPGGASARIARSASAAVGHCLPSDAFHPADVSVTLMRAVAMAIVAIG
jgi:hypothetical protein